jgi:hypothetical protein
MSQITEIPRNAAARQSPLGTFVVLLRGLDVRLDPVLIGLAGLFAGLGIYSLNQAIATARYVAHELAEIGPWLVASVCIAAAAPP